MAYQFVKSSSQSLRVGSSPVTGVPLTAAFWVRTTGIKTSNGICIENTGSNSRFSVGINTVDGALNAYAQSLSSSSVYYQAVTSVGSIAFNSLYHVAGVFSANNSRTVYLNGTTTASNGSNHTVGALNCVSIAESRIPAYPGYGDCQLAEIGIWDVALTAAEIEALAKGMTCDKVRPQSLKFYAPLVRDIIDAKGGLTITNNNTATVADHPRVYA